jgi:hypothetical protein
LVHLSAERERRAVAGRPESFAEENLYPDARSRLASPPFASRACSSARRAIRPIESKTILRDLDLAVGTSDGWGVEKPSAAFFERIVVEAGCPTDQVLYVGDRLDNDIRPAQAARWLPRWYAGARGGTSSAIRISPRDVCGTVNLLSSCRIWSASTTSRRPSLARAGQAVLVPASPE